MYLLRHGRDIQNQAVCLFALMTMTRNAFEEASGYCTLSLYEYIQQNKV